MTALVVAAIAVSAVVYLAAARMVAGELVETFAAEGGADDVDRGMCALGGLLWPVLVALVVALVVTVGLVHLLGFVMFGGRGDDR